MCGILHLCIPIELRFLGSYVEFLAKKDFHHLRDVEGKANNKQELSNISDIDKMIRTQMAVYLALLHSSNRTCAHQLFLMIKRYMQTAVTVIDRLDTQSVHNILLVLSMAMNHPAFSFVEKTEMFHFYSRAEQEAAKAKEKSATDQLYLSEPFGLYDLDLRTPLMFTPDVLHVHTINCQPVVPAQPLYSSIPPVVNIPVETEKVHVKHLEVRDSRPSKTDTNTIEYRIQVTWSNGDKKEIYKTFKEITDFHKRMSEQFPDGLHSLKMQQLTGNTNHRKEMTSFLNEYIQKLLDLQANIKDSITFRKFFGAVVLMADASTSPTLQSVSRDNNPIAKHVPNSGNKDSVIEADADNQNLSPSSNCLDGSQIGNICSMTNFGTSPQNLALSAHSHIFSTKIASPLMGSPRLSTSSESPINSCLSSPYADRLDCNRLASFLKCPDLAAHQNVLANYTFEQLSLMKVEEIESMGLPKEVATTMKSLLDAEKIKDLSPRLLNGVVDRMLPQNANHAAYSPQTVFPPQVYNTVPPAYLYGYLPFQNTAPQPIVIGEPSPTNSDSSSLSPRSCIQASPSPMTMQSNVQSQSDSSSEEDKFARQSNGNGKYKGHSPFIPYQSRQCDQMVNIENKYEPISSSGTPPLAAELSEVNSLGSSGYRSDPTFDTSPAHFLRSPNSAKPTHTQNINPQYFITMPGNSVPHQHNATMTTASDGLGYSMVQYIDNRPMGYVNNSNMIGRTFGPFTGPRPYYSPGYMNSNPLLNQQQQNVVNSVGKLSVYPGAQGVVLHKGAVTGNNVILNGNDNSQKIQCASAADALAGRMPVAINSATPGCATVTSSSNTGSISHPRCTSCGCSGHANSIPNPGIAVYHPFSYAWPPYHNGYVPMPHSLYLPHQTPYSNGLNQEVFANHAQSFAAPNLGAQGVTGSQVMQSPSNLNNSNRPPGGYSKKKSCKINCSNCGSLRHLATECPDGSMEAMSGPTLYSYRPTNESD